MNEEHRQSLRADTTDISPLLAARPDCEDQVDDFTVSYKLGPRESLATQAADIDGDGRTDLLFTNQLDASVTIYWGNEAGELAESSEFKGVRSESSVATGDLNEDGYTDLLFASRDHASFVIRPGLDQRRFGEPVEIFQGSEPGAPLLEDWDGDGHQDLLFRHRDCIAWRKGNGTTSFAPHECLGPPKKPIGLVDVDGDGRAELIIHDERGLSAWSSGPRGWIEKRTRLFDQTPAHTFSSLADIDRDGREEVYVVEDSPGGSTYRWKVGESEPCRLGDAPYWNRGTYGLRATDFNGDKVLDFISARTCAHCTSNHILHRGGVKEEGTASSSPKENSSKSD
jgi:hypothetical protein